MKRPVAFHPPLFALHPPLALYASNVSLIPLADTFIPIATLVLLACSAWGLLALLLRDIARSAAAVSIFTFCFFSFGAIQDNVTSNQYKTASGLVAEAFVVAWALPTLVLCILAAWKWKGEWAIRTFLNVAGVALCGLAALSIAGSHLAIRSQLAQARESHAESAGKAPASTPDIFYILLDGYGRTDVFERLYGFTDEPFIRGLRDRGFYVAADARSNYSQTEISLASTLNFEFAQDFAKPVGNAPAERLLLDRMIDESRVSRVLQGLGYRYFAITTGFPALTFPSADVEFKQDTGRTLYLDALLRKTPIPPTREQMSGMVESRRNALSGGFSRLKQLAPKSAAPRFVFAHIFAPHPPFVFDKDGNPTPQIGIFDYADGSHFLRIFKSAEAYKNGYAGQAQYVGKLVLEVVDALLKAPGQKPIILIQGDHGPKLHMDQDSVERTDVNEVFPILSAYFVPPEVRQKLYPSISPVNSFRVVFNEQFGQELPLLKDRSFYSPWEKPLVFVEVTDTLKKREIDGAPHTPQAARSGRQFQ